MQSSQIGSTKRHRKVDIITLSLLLAVVLSVWTVFRLASAASTGATRTFDEQILKMMRQHHDNTLPIGGERVSGIARDITSLGSLPILVMLGTVVAGYFVVQRYWIPFGILIISLAGGQLLTSGLKTYFARERPGVISKLVTVTNSSFPSGHTLLATVFYFTLGALLARTTTKPPLKVFYILMAFLFSFLVGLSRIYLGVHYPTDVLAGWIVGLMWAICCSVSTRYLQHKTGDLPSDVIGSSSNLR